MVNMDEMFYGTLPQDTQDFTQVLRGVGRSIRDIGRGVSYYPYDLLGAPVDIINMALQPVGLGSQTPVLGSDYLRNIAQSLGYAQPSTGSGAETAGRFGAALINPAAGARAVGQAGNLVTRGANLSADRLVQMITGNPQATAPRVLEETSMPFMQAMAPKIVKPGDQVSGLTVREEVPNMGSISATLDDYEVLSGIREVPRGAFDKEYLDSLSFEKLDKRTKDLANQINESKEINPMIVGVDSKGAYIIEGGHRFDALMAQDTKSIPAMVVIDKSDPPTEDVLKGLLEPEVSYRGSHTAPNASKYGATLDSLEGIMPADVYSSRGKSLYGLGNPKVDAEWFAAAYKAKGNPDAEVTIYRAVPRGVKDINSGDWVTTSKTYADMHGENTIGDEYEIISRKVKAKTLSSEGYPYEFGYNE